MSRHVLGLTDDDQPTLRIIGAFCVTVATVALAFVVQIILVIALAVVQMAWASGQTAAEGAEAGPPFRLESLFTSTAGLLALTIPQQVIFSAVPLVAAWFSPLGVRRRLALTAGHLPLWTWVVLVAGAPAIGIVGQLLVSPFVSIEQTSVHQEMMKLFAVWTGVWLIPLTLLFSIPPGIGEEVLFRGYLQTRLSRHWPVWFVVPLVGTLFAAIHLEPAHVVAVLLMGIYVSLIRWKTGSLWPCIFAHAIHNMYAVQASVWTAHLDDEASLVEMVSDVGFLSALALFSISGLAGLGAIGVVMFVRPNRPMDSAPRDGEPDPATPAAAQTTADAAPITGEPGWATPESAEQG